MISQLFVIDMSLLNQILKYINVEQSWLQNSYKKP